ncbi:MAG TPA: bifunctional phosphoribosylaminoimidazolecarboxamide formyltransferase/IMP cyclohydrolase [Spirochaetota bacterium]|nr:bifunctional phosphoribosylaminoimidazolecarboxamide formyltransferase/IMP cyclohydrolase [Spirochaetota bacterium]HPN81971.1 bifunctional phosphoribosylaminoimidazolecarboxamide formyltransferase/IMP cyclohydrolase [Spirochaetota bacterium]
MRALISVSDKTGVVELARGLSRLGWEIVSTGGTAAHLAAAGVAVTDASSVTGFPEMLGGRVKTLHPHLFAGILARRGQTEDMQTIQAHAILPVDLVAVNLYPFAETLTKDGITDAAVIEQIDIGGPSLLRAAAKNHRDVWVVCNPADYARVLGALDKPSADDESFRRELAGRVFRHTAAYDAIIADWFSSRTEGPEDVPQEFLATGILQQTLRYGENPHQKAAFYRDAVPSAAAGVPDCRQLQGKELSYNNILDLSAAFGLAREFATAQDPFCCILKHNNPCGAALAEDLVTAFERAWSGDSEAAFGSVIGLTREVDSVTAAAIATRFVEIVVAPGFSAEALEIFGAKKNLRLMVFDKPLLAGQAAGWTARRVSGGWLRQETDPAGVDRSLWSVASQRQPEPEELDDCEFLWKIVKHVRSNAICIGSGRTLLGCGAGQMSRVDSVRIAIGKARGRAPRLAMASDAFFPFRDGADLAAEGGVTVIIQPGGSIRDDEVRAACDEHGMAQVLSGRRHFLH